MKAIEGYIGKNDHELTFREGDTIFVPEQFVNSKEKMIQGVCNGKVGLFPRVYVNDTTVEIKEAGKTTRCEATHAYEAANEEELSFPKGAKMFVVGEESATHWKGVYGGKAGLIPKSHVHDATKPPEDKALAGLRCRAIKTYVTDDLGAIAFKVGDIVFVPKPSAEGDTYEGVSGGVIG